MSKFKIGDRVRRIKFLDEDLGVYLGGDEFNVNLIGKFGGIIDPDGLTHSPEYLELVAPTSPVREVTKREIVPGVYGRVELSPYAKGSVSHVGVRFEPMTGSYAALNATELRAAAAVLLELAGALEQ